MYRATSPKKEEKMLQEEMQGVVLIVELRPYNPIEFTTEEKHTYGKPVKIATLATYLREAWRWTNPNSGKPDCILQCHAREDVYFRPGQDIDLHYVAGGDEMEYTDRKPEYVFLEPSLCKIPRLMFCLWLSEVRSTWAGWTVGTQLAFLKNQYPHFVKEAGTYAFETVFCSDELAAKIGTDQV